MTRFAIPRSIALAAVAALVPAALHAAPAERQPAPTPAETTATASNAEAEYTKAIEKRADDVLAALALDDPAKAGRVRQSLLTQYRALRDWHDANDPELKKLKAAADKSTAEARVEEIKATLRPIHDAFLERLAQDLAEEQVEKVKDKMTYNVLHVTYGAYQKMLPTLTEQQKAKIMETLKTAREEAMDGGSSEEKHAIFGRYKGRINNYLSSEGYDLKKASKEWAERERAAKNDAAPAGSSGK